MSDLALYRIGERRTSGKFRVLVLEYRIPETFDVTPLGTFMQAANAKYVALEQQVAALQSQLAAVPATPAIEGDADDKAQISAFAATLGIADPTAAVAVPAAAPVANATPAAAPPASAIDRL